MPSLADLQAGFRAAVLGTGCPEGLAAPDAAELDQRFAVYRNNVMVALTGALSKRFPVVVRLVGPDFAQALFSEFARAHPPHTPLMMDYGTDMPGFLAGFPPVARLPYLPDIARLELARGEAYHAADVAPATAEALGRVAGAPPEAVRLRLHPSVRVVVSAHPVHTLWTRNQPGAAAGGPVDWRSEAVLVARCELAVITERLGAGDAAFIASLCDGATLAEAGAAGFGADPGFDPAPVLARLIGSGLVIDAGCQSSIHPATEATQ